MTIEEFLAEIFVDFLEQSMLANNEISDSEEFDAMFYDDEGEQMSDIEFVGEHCGDIADPDIVDGIYYYLIDDGCDFDFSIDKIVSHFVINYIYDNYGDKSLSTIMKYLKKADFKDIVDLFKKNEAFGKSFVTSYLDHYNDELDYEAIREEMRENDDIELIDRWFALSADYCSLNELLRRVIVNLYDRYISTGCDEKEAYNNVWGYFIKDFDPLGELDKMGIDFASKQRLKAYLLRIIYSDLYEDICNGPIIDSINVMDKISNNLVVTMAKCNSPAIPAEPEIRNRIMHHFILLHYEKQKRIDNRRATIKEGRGPVLKKFHPGHQLDIIDFIKK